MKKIGEIKGIPVVEGNENEVTRNQIHYKEEGGGIQLSKRGNDNKLNNVTGSSSSGNGGVKEYYYKIITDNEEMIAIVREIAQMCNITSVLYKRYDGKIVKLNGYIISNGSVTNAGVFISKSNICFAISSDSYTALQEHEDYIQIVIGSGDLFDKVKSAGLDDQTLEILNSCVQEITKEEYESMITYKPE